MTVAVQSKSGEYHTPQPLNYLPNPAENSGWHYLARLANGEEVWKKMSARNASELEGAIAEYSDPRNSKRIQANKIDAVSVPLSGDFKGEMYVVNLKEQKFKKKGDREGKSMALKKF